MKKIIVTIHTEGRLSGMIEIESNDLGFTYSDTGLGMDGTQGKWTGGSPEYNELQKLCRQMTYTIQKINELH